MRKLLGLVAGLALLALSSGAQAQLNPPLAYRTSNCAEASQLLPCLNGTIRDINNGVSAQSASGYTYPRNILDNGGLQVQQRGTGTVTCGTTTIPSSAYGPDRWGCNVNVTSGAGSLVADNTAADLPSAPVFNSGFKFYRTSGALAQPQCVMQEIPSSRILPLQGQNLVLSAYIKGMANMIAESTTVNAYFFYGTGTDQGLQSFTASPAITPAFSGINSSLTTAWTITASWARYSYSFAVPAAATEGAVALCWTPTTGGTAGATDGFLFTGMQLEVGATAGTFEFRTYQDELANAQRFYAQWADSPAATFTLPGTCTETSSGATAACELMLPTTMFKTPVVAVATATSFGMTKVADGTAEACTTLATVASSSNLNSIKLTCAVSETAAVGTMHIMLYAATGAANTITVSADF